jgi:hypothetical protein
MGLARPIAFSPRAKLDFHRPDFGQAIFRQTDHPRLSKSKNGSMFLPTTATRGGLCRGSKSELHRTWAVIDDPVNRSPRSFSRRDVAKERMVLPWMLD